MVWLICIAAFIVLLLALFAIVLYKIYEYAFKRDPKRDADPFFMPDEEGYTKYRKESSEFIQTAMDAPVTEEIRIKSFDGTELYARYYENCPGAPVMLVFHGYRGNALREGCGGFRTAKLLNINILLPDQRAHGKSGGKCITMGVKERCDCLEWVKYTEERFGSVDKVLVGLSMGAATVMMASDLPLPESVKGIWADCGYSSPADIITEVAVSRGLPRGISRFCGCLAARIYGGFDLDGASAEESLKKCKIPVLFIHGREDNFVPCYMSELCYEACASEKHLLIVDGATHAMSYYVDPEGYAKCVRMFTKRTLGLTDEE